MKRLTIVVLLLFISFQIYAKPTNQKIDKILNELFDKDGPGGVAIVVKDGKTIYRKAFGMANLELGVKMTPDFIFRIGSVTKQFTAAAIVQLAEQGKIDLTADITQYIKDFPTHGQKISIENLLTHTSGVKNFTSTKEWTQHKKMQYLSSIELVNFFKDQPMTMVPGEKYEYSNSNYVLLGRIIEIVSGQSYQQYLQDNIFNPLKMANTSYDSTKRIIKNRAYGYAKNGDVYENADYISMTQPFAAGAIVSTVDDLAKWQQGLFSYQVISKKNLEKASEPFVLNNGDTAGYGYSWGVNGWNIKGEPMISYNGSIAGFKASTKYLTKKGVYVAILSNCRCNNGDDVSEQIAAIIIGSPYEWKQINLSEKTLNSYEGVYTSDKHGERFVSFENNNLRLYKSGGKKSIIVPFEKNSFFYKDKEFPTTEVKFLTNTNGGFTSIKLTSTGRDAIWTKTNKKVLSYPAIEVSNKQLKSYVGKYELGPNFYLNIFIEGNTLYAQATGQNKHKLRAYEKNKFVSESHDIQNTFNYDEKNKVKSITAHVVIDYHAKKIE